MSITDMRRKIHNARPDELMTTRDFLIYESRNNVDQFLFHAVRKRILVRWARGVFSKDPLRPPTIRQLAEVKARAFKKRIVEDPKDTAHRLGLVKTGNDEVVFQVNGRSSSFMTYLGRVTLKGACQKRMYLADTKTASVIRGLCHLGEDGFSSNQIKELVKWFPLRDKNELHIAAAWMPWWLSNYTPKPLFFMTEPNLFDLVRKKATQEWAFSSGAA